MCHYHRPAVKSRGPEMSTTWVCREEWEQVYTWLYSSDTGHVKKGLGRVAVWKTRGEVPMVIEMTANLCECRLHERKEEGGGTHYQTLILEYTMAIARFVNGIADIAKDRLKISANLLTCVHEYGIPSWVVTLRHVGTHEKLPSIGALRLGAEFCLSWLRANYWRPQRLTIGELQDESCSRSATPSKGEIREGRRGVANIKEGRVWKLSRGLCISRDQLVNILIRSNYMELSDYLIKKHLLQFPSSIKYTVKVPDMSSFDCLSSLSIGDGDIGIWRTHLLKIAKESPSFKQTLISALIATINNSSCEMSLRNFLCGWLNILFSSCPQQQTGSEQQTGSAGLMQVNSIHGDVDDSFLPGIVDWMELLNVSTQHPGIYSYAIMKIITEHVQPLINTSIIDNMMHLSALVTLSAKIGHTSYIKDHTHMASKYSTELENMKVACAVQREETSINSPEDSTTVVEGSEVKRWNAIKDVRAWIDCPLGLFPGQKISAHMLDLPFQDTTSEGETSGTMSYIPNDVITDDVINNDVITDDVIPPCELDDCQIIEVQQLVHIL